MNRFLLTESRELAEAKPSVSDGSLVKDRRQIWKLSNAFLLDRKVPQIEGRIMSSNCLA